MRPSIGIAKGTGLLIQNPSDGPTFQPMRGGHGDLHLYWQPVYQDVIRSVGPLAAFLPSATYEGSGNKVLFSYIEGGRDILSLTRPIRRNEGIPGPVLDRLDSALRSFKAIANRDGTSPDVRRFVEEFTLPSIYRFPEAYRVYEPSIFSTKRYFLLWGLEPIGDSGLTRSDIGQVQAELRDRRSSVIDVFNLLLRILPIAFILALVAWIIAYILLPEPKVNFSISAVAGKRAFVENQSYLLKTLGLEFGDSSYDWSFDGADIPESKEREPVPTWTHPGSKKVSLKATHSSILWLSKTNSLEKEISVSEVQVPQPTPTPTPVPPPVRKLVPMPDSVPIPVQPIEPTPIDPTQTPVQPTEPTPKTDKPAEPIPIDPTQTPVQPTEPMPKTDKPAEPMPKSIQPPRFPIGDASIIWFGSRAEGINQPRVWATLDVAPPPGFKVERVSIAGVSRNYEGRFEQLVNLGQNAVEIEVSKVSTKVSRQTLRGIVQFNRPFEVIEKPTEEHEIPPGDTNGSDKVEPLNPKTVPNLSPSKSA